LPAGPPGPHDGAGTGSDGEEETVEDETPDGRPSDGTQARGLLRAVHRADVDVRDVWFRCFTLGGDVGELEIDAYLHGCLQLTPAEQDLLARAVFELTG